MHSCRFCRNKIRDWEEDGFYGYKCGSCNSSSIFIVSSDQRGPLNEEEKEKVKTLCKKYYPNYEITWISNTRKNIKHWYDILRKI